MASDSTLLSVIMGSLQVVGLFLPVVVLTTRFVILGLQPEGGENPVELEDKRERQKKLASFSIVLIVLLSLSGAILIFSVLLIFELPISVILGIGLLAVGFVGFGLALGDAVNAYSILIEGEKF